MRERRKKYRRIGTPAPITPPKDEIPGQTPIRLCHFLPQAAVINNRTLSTDNLPIKNDSNTPKRGGGTDDLPCKTETSLPINPIKQKTITLSVPVKQAQMPPDFPRHTNECQGTFPKSISSKDPYTQKRGEEIALFPSGIPLLVESSTNNCSTSNYRIFSEMFFNCASTSKSTFTVASFLGILKIVAFP